MKKFCRTVGAEAKLCGVCGGIGKQNPARILFRTGYLIR